MERLVDCLGVLPDVELLLMNLTLSALEEIRHKEIPNEIKCLR